MTAYESTASKSNRHHPGVRIAVVQGAEPDDWRRIYDRINNGSGSLGDLLLCIAAATCTFLGLFGVAGLLTLAILWYSPEISPYYLASAVVLPSLLFGAAAGQNGGNLFLRFRYRLDDSARRGFATRLSLGRCPPDWSIHVKRWLFTGDWLGMPAYDLRLPYVRIYVEGQAPASCREEDGLWREIHGNISGDSLWEAGTNIREISYPRQLPSWAREVDNGDGFENLRERIGNDEASEWVMHLWRRACRQWPALGVNDYPEKARKECFEMHSIALSDGRQALVVVLRPTTFVAELEEAADSEDSIAA